MKKFMLLVAAAVAMSATACGDEITNNHYNNTERVTNVTMTNTGTTVVIRETVTKTETTTVTVTKTTTVVVVRTTTVVMTVTTTVGAVVPGNTGTVSASLTSYQGSNSITPWVGFSERAYEVNYAIGSTQDGVLRRIELGVFSGVVADAGVMVKACRGSLRVENSTWDMPCTVDGNTLVLERPFYIVATTGVILTLQMASNPNAPTGTYSIPVTNIVMDTGRRDEVFTTLPSNGSLTISHYQTIDPMCVAMEQGNNPEVVGVTGQVPAPTQVAEIRRGTMQPIIRLEFHTCVEYYLPNPFSSNYFTLTMTRTSTSPTLDGGQGFHDVNGAQRQFPVSTQLMISTPPFYSHSYTTQAWPVSVRGPNFAVSQNNMFLHYASDLTYQVQGDCSNLPLGETYELILTVTIQGQMSDQLFATGRFRCVE